MQPWLDSLLTLEGLAVVLALAYLLLAARENPWCWLCAFISSALYVEILWDVSLLMESVLSIFYVVMAVVGWYEWKRGGAGHTGVQIVRLQWWHHFALLGITLLLAALNGWLLGMYTSAARPFVDSFVSWGSVITTILVVRKVLDNWLYWLLIDGMSAYLYIDRGLYLTALLFGLYLIIVVFGYFQWRTEWRKAPLVYG
ncbi:MAG: nicotinamide riboside transporter PnuC, partial [Pseudomonadota bacterium]